MARLVELACKSGSLENRIELTRPQRNGHLPELEGQLAPEWDSYVEKCSSYFT